MSKLKSKKVWITTDGQEFGSKDEAEKMQRSLEFSEWYDGHTDNQLEFLKSVNHNARYVLDEDIQDWLQKNQKEVFKLLRISNADFKETMDDLYDYFSNQAEIQNGSQNEVYFRAKAEVADAVVNYLDGSTVELEDQKL